MKVSEIMTPDAIVVRPEASLREACEKMRDGDIGFLPVCDSERIHGAITDRDIATRAIAEDKDPLGTHVKEIMSSHIVYVYEDQDELEAARLMQVKQIRRLVVLNRDKRMVGVVSLSDISVVGKEYGLAGEILEKVAEHPR